MMHLKMEEEPLMLTLLDLPDKKTNLNRFRQDKNTTTVTETQHLKQTTAEEMTEETEVMEVAVVMAEIDK